MPATYIADTETTWNLEMETEKCLYQRKFKSTRKTVFR